MALSIIISSLGAESLTNTLYSIEEQPIHKDDQIIIVADTHSDPDVTERIRSIVVEHPTIYVEVYEHDAGFHAWGHPQKNYGITKANKGNWLVWMDEDDEFSQGAFYDVLPELEKHPSNPHIFRFIHPSGAILPHSQARKAELCQIGGHCLVVRNHRVGRWNMRDGTYRYESDFDFIEQTLELNPEPIWHTTIIAVSRP